MEDPPKQPDIVAILTGPPPPEGSPVPRVRTPLTKEERRAREGERFMEEEADRVFTVSGTLRQKGKGKDFVEFTKALHVLMLEHGVTENPCLNITVVWKNGKRTPIAALDKS